MREREGVKGAFAGGEVDQVLRQPFLAQLFGDHLLVNGAALEHRLHKMARVLLEQGNEAVHQVVRDERQVGADGLDLLLDLLLDFGIDGEGEAGEGLDGRGFVLVLAQRVAPFDGRELDAVDVVHQLVKPGRKLLVGLDVQFGLEQYPESPVEFLPGLFEVPRPVVGQSRFVLALSLPD